MVCRPLIGDIYRSWYLSLDILPSMAAFRPWFHTSLLKPAGPQPAGLPALEDDSCKVEAIVLIKKHETHAEMK